MGQSAACIACNAQRRTYRRGYVLSHAGERNTMNRAARRKQQSISRQIDKLAPGQRELAIQAGMDLYDASKEARDKELDERWEAWFRKKSDELYDRAYEHAYREIYKEMPEDMAKAADQGIKESMRWRHAYMSIFIAAHNAKYKLEAASYRMTVREAIKAAREDTRC